MKKTRLELTAEELEHLLEHAHAVAGVLTADESPELWQGMSLKLHRALARATLREMPRPKHDVRLTSHGSMGACSGSRQRVTTYTRVVANRRNPKQRPDERKRRLMSATPPRRRLVNMDAVARALLSRNLASRPPS